MKHGQMLTEGRCVVRQVNSYRNEGSFGTDYRQGIVPARYDQKISSIEYV